MGVKDATPKPSREVRQVAENEKILAQLDRILSSKGFRRADRLKRFLTFTVNETLAGHGEQLKEFVIGVEVFDKGPKFDPRSDPIVRVQARRMRGQLANYYHEEGQNEETIIELPKGGYTPIFRSSKGTLVRQPAVPTAVNRNTILLMPFSDYSEANDLKNFCAGLNQEIVHRMTGLNAIKLIIWSRHDVDGSPDPREAALRDNAGTILNGSVRGAGGEIRIMANLIDASSGCSLWSESFDRKTDHIFAVQEEIARAIADRLGTETEGTGSLRRTRRPAGNLAAHNLCVQGSFHLNQRTEEGLRKALEFFEKAVAEDAQSALAYSGLSDAYGLSWHYGFLPPSEAWTKTASHAAWAVRLDDQSPEAHTSLAHVKSTQDWDWSGAEAEYLRAIDLDPRYPTVHHWYSTTCLAPQGRLDEAKEQILIARELDPISSIIARDVAAVHYLRRDLGSALDQCDHAIELNPHFPQAYWILGLVQEQRGDFDESAAAFQRAITLAPQSPRMHAALGRTLALSGRTEQARQILKSLHDRADHRYDSPFDLASLYFALGDRECGFKWLTQAFQNRCFEVLSIKVDPRFDPFRDDPKFKELVIQLGLN
jgi:TolB-like protein/Tfp pilus assembly protein PilF